MRIAVFSSPYEEEVATLRRYFAECRMVDCDSTFYNFYNEWDGESN